ncbi:predicted protein [Chaetomium globosum CBS 148.51]|uniref:Uncharacterized protein n=1 Tax=Chaetomium globosum (strain ATCC 6205 / CBS 148.51 / DSM 1962 / NBRC 6347 / NRRL 1970) TaxID=306901 RepID=Q2GU20_CHAGB|nr:uncharacterized protein CHGG_08534 [Chaetomium globosum CBS 148.51]EAQ84520.1 predicted protein [Chaetomium globosum CBS 148.51]
MSPRKEVRNQRVIAANPAATPTLPIYAAGPFRPRYADFECNLCAQGTLANTKLRGTPQELAAFPSFWQLPDAPPVVLDRRAHLHDFLSFSIGRGTRGRLAAQTTFTTSPVPLDATPLADVAYMDPPLSIWPASRSGDLPPAIDLAQQPALAKRGSPRMNLKDKSETLDDESQVAARTDFVFGREGANDESMTEFGLVQRMEKETRLAAVDDIVSILFLWERLVEGLAEWSWLLPCSDLGLETCAAKVRQAVPTLDYVVKLVPDPSPHPSATAVFRQPPTFTTPNQTEVIARESASNSRQRELGIRTMSTNESPTQAHSPSSFQEDLGEWAWLHQTTTPDMSQFPLVPPSPMYQTFNPDNSQAAVPPLMPETASYPTMNTNLTDSLGSSPVELLVHDIDPFMAFQLGLYLGSTGPSWAVPESCGPADLFASTLDGDLFSGLDFAPGPFTHTPPHGSTSPATSLYDMDALYLPSNHYAPADPLTPISLASGTPESALSPSSPATIFSQALPCPEFSRNNGAYNNTNSSTASPSAASTTTTTTTPNPNDPTPPPNKPDERKRRETKRMRFRCPVTPATTARCTQGFLDARTLHRHVWTHHKAYAREHNVPSEQTGCEFPGCGYMGRGDNVARHMKRHGR